MVPAVLPVILILVVFGIVVSYQFVLVVLWGSPEHEP